MQGRNLDVWVRRAWCFVGEFREGAKGRCGAAILVRNKRVDEPQAGAVLRVSVGSAKGPVLSTEGLATMLAPGAALRSSVGSAKEPVLSTKVAATMPAPAAFLRVSVGSAKGPVLSTEGPGTMLGPGSVLRVSVGCAGGPVRSTKGTGTMLAPGSVLRVSVRSANAASGRTMQERNLGVRVPRKRSVAGEFVRESQVIENYLPGSGMADRFHALYQ